MCKIMLNDLLRLDSNSKDFKEGKIRFNIEYNGVRYLDKWMENKDNEDGYSFSYYTYNSKESRKQISNGDMIINAVQLKAPDQWLLIQIVRVIEVRTNNSTYAKVEILKEYEKYFGRVIFRHRKNQGTIGYTFTIRKMLDSCEVIKILEKSFDGFPFPGYSNLNIPMRKLMTMIREINNNEEWISALKAVKAVYCLNDHKAHKVYIGSAYNKSDCLYGRWRDYFNSYHGDNKSLRELFDKNDENYFLDNIYFSILETFTTNTDNETIIRREHHWMDVFDSRNPDVGYNNN